MKTLALAVSVSLLAIPASEAQTRPSTTTMACRAANALVVSRGEIVLSTGRDIFDRYVSMQYYCGPGEKTIATFVPSADNPQCFIGYRCVSESLDEN